MKFKYKNYGYGVIRPVIPIEIIYNNIPVSYEVLIDSGADVCIFDSQIGEILGIDIASGEKEEVWGITGYGEPYYLHPVTIKVGGWSYEIKAGFLPNIAKLGYGIVGQKGFFNLFEIKFNHLKEEIELRSIVTPKIFTK